MNANFTVTAKFTENTALQHVLIFSVASAETYEDWDKHEQTKAPFSACVHPFFFHTFLR